jgi:hypothetical protein
MRTLVAVLLSGAVMAPRVPDRQDASASDRLLQAVERRHRETVDPTDPRAAAARLGFDRAKILEFVRTEIAWEPYGGLLRDAAGTLLARSGNSLDRALLLQSMLEAGGEKTRLMRVELAEADGAMLLEDFRKRDPKSRLARPDSDPKALAGELGVDPGALQALVQERRREEKALVDEVLEAAKAETARLAPLVGPVAARALAAPREHFWPQAWDGSKKDWVDLDPSPVEIPRKGGRPATAAELAVQRRSLTFRLVMNRKSGEKSEPVALLTVPADLSAVSWRAVDFVLQPLKGQLPPAAKLAELDEKGRVEAFRQVKTYRAGLVIDGKYFGGLPFDLTGKVYEVDAGGRVGPAKALAGGLNKAFGGVLGGGGGGQAAAASTLENVVLEVAVKEPGSPERVHKRAVYATPKAEGKVHALPALRYSFLVDGAPLPPGERGRRELAAIARNAAALRKVFKGERDGVHFNQHAEVSSLLLRFADLRRRLVMEINAGGGFLQDRVGIAAETSQVFVDEGAGRLMLRRGIDIFDNPVSLDSGDRTMTLGVAETVLECLLVARGWPGDSSRSAWTAIGRARLLGGKAEALDRDGRREIRWSADAWWSVDPATGGCVGRVPSGAGQGLVEAAWENASEVCNYSDLAGFAAATQAGPAWASDATNLMGKACSYLGGTWARDQVKDKMDELAQGMWNGSINALAGM